MVFWASAFWAEAFFFLKIGAGGIHKKRVYWGAVSYTHLERKVQRINELTRISRERELTEEEQQERQALRMEYVESVKKNLAAQLNSTVVVDEKGHRRPLRPKK